MRSVLEMVALFAALFLIMPYIPSHDGYGHQFEGKHWLAIALFTLSRLLRWSQSKQLALIEAVLFGVFVWALVMIYGVL